MKNGFILPSMAVFLNISMNTNDLIASGNLAREQHDPAKAIAFYAQAFVQDPEQFDDTAKLAAAGKLEAKLQQRAQLMKQNYAQLPEDEKEKDRVVARALLQAIRGEQQPGMAEGEQQPGADYRDPPEDKDPDQYGDDYQAMVARVKKLAGLGPMKTVYDPARRQYRNMPTAQQPKK
jgi:hypothetical protein